MAHCTQCGREAGSARRCTFCAAKSGDWLEQTLDNDFEIQAKIGQGGFAIVYRAVQRSLQRDVVIKFLRPELTQKPPLVERFRREAQLAAKLGHNHIASIFHIGQTEDGTPYFVMEYVNGTPLSRLLRQGGVKPKRAARILRQIAGALDFAHQHAIIHRDLKPDNVMVITRGLEDQIKLLDFGIAKEEGAKNLTKTGELIGTPEYMSPEQCQGERITKASDIYSLGVVAFELLSGRPPFQGSAMGLLLLHTTQEPPTLAEVVGKPFPNTVEGCIAKALSKHPAHRYQSASELAVALLTAIDMAGPEAIPEALVRQRLPEPNTSERQEAAHQQDTLPFSVEEPGPPTAPSLPKAQKDTIVTPAPRPQETNERPQTGRNPPKPPAPLPKPQSPTAPAEEPEESPLLRHLTVLLLGLAIGLLFLLLYLRK